MRGDVRRLDTGDAAAVLAVVNDAAERYREVIPAAADTVPYMSMATLAAELDRMTAFGLDRDGLVAVIGVQERDRVSLIRHLYVRTDAQRQGYGSRLLERGLEHADADTVLVGTWAAATWAIAFYERHGFERVDRSEPLLATHWDVPARQRAASVVLRYERPG